MLEGGYAVRFSHFVFLCLVRCLLPFFFCRSLFFLGSLFEKNYGSELLFLSAGVGLVFFGGVLLKFWPYILAVRSRKCLENSLDVRSAVYKKLFGSELLVFGCPRWSCVCWCCFAYVFALCFGGSLPKMSGKLHFLLMSGLFAVWFLRFLRSGFGFGRSSLLRDFPGICLGFENFLYAGSGKCCSFFSFCVFVSGSVFLPLFAVLLFLGSLFENIVGSVLLFLGVGVGLVFFGGVLLRFWPYTLAVRSRKCLENSLDVRSVVFKNIFGSELLFFGCRCWSCVCWCCFAYVFALCFGGSLPKMSGKILLMSGLFAVWFLCFLRSGFGFGRSSLLFPPSSSSFCSWGRPGFLFLSSFCVPAGHRPPEEGRALQHTTCTLALFFSLPGRLPSPSLASLSFSLSRAFR